MGTEATSYRAPRPHAAWSDGSDDQVGTCDYDALSVALAAALDVEIVTLDRSLAAAPGLPARVRLATE